MTDTEGEAVAHLLSCLPDCMMPDGADPCKGYHALNEQCRARLAEAQALVEMWKGNCKTANRQLAEAQRDVQRIKNKIDTRLNNALCEMKEGCDDSIVGFNEAWGIVRECFPERQ